MKKLNLYTSKSKTSTLVYELASKYMGAINPYQVLNYNKAQGYYYFGRGDSRKEKIDVKEMAEFTNEVAIFKSLRLYKIFTESLRATVMDRLLSVKSTKEDIMFSQAMLYNLDVLETIMERLSKPDDLKSYSYMDGSANGITMPN